MRRWHGLAGPPRLPPPPPSPPLARCNGLPIIGTGGQEGGWRPPSPAAAAAITATPAAAPTVRAVATLSQLCPRDRPPRTTGPRGRACQAANGWGVGGRGRDG